MDSIEAGRVAHQRDDLLGVLASVLSAHPDVRFAYLFGSMAKGRARRGSDVDVAVWLDVGPGVGSDRSAMMDRGLELEGVLERALARRVQVVVLNLAPMAVQHNVLRHGLVIPGGDEPSRRGFYVDHARRYFDLEPARTLFARRRMQRIAEGTFGGRARNGPESAGVD